MYMLLKPLKLISTNLSTLTVTDLLKYEVENPFQF